MLKSFRIFGKKFAELREERGFTQDSLARTTGRSKGTFARYEGEVAVGISPAILDDVAVAFEMDVKSILARIGVEEIRIAQSSKDVPPLEAISPDLRAWLETKTIPELLHVMKEARRIEAKIRGKRPRIAAKKKR